MKTLVFTICARNYIGLAKVMARSIARHGPDADVRIYVAEDIADQPAGDGAPAIMAAPRALSAFIGPVEYANMAFMYNITEFCTALKAACFMRGFADGYDTCFYMDPDTFLTAKLAHMTGMLNDHAILVTPHLCLPSAGEGPRSDHGILATGIYNLGFLGLRRHPEAQRFLAWWHTRLRGQAFNDHYHALYTDQRWIDFVPALFASDAVRIWRHLGCNVAPWNYHERRIEADGDGFVVSPRAPQAAESSPVPVIFFHFSGFDFRLIIEGRFDQLNLATSEAYPDLHAVYAVYAAEIRVLADEVREYLSLPYGFDRFSDGAQILPSHRRLFRVWRQRHGEADDPFAVGPGSFHAALAARGLLGRPGTRDLAADKATARTVADPGSLIRRARSVFRIIFRLAGRARFMILVRGLNRLSNVEEHYDTFRIDGASVRRADANSADLPA